MGKPRFRDSREIIYGRGELKVESLKLKVTARKGKEFIAQRRGGAEQRKNARVSGERADPIEC
jgi:hypothetical protein